MYPVYKIKIKKSQSHLPFKEGLEALFFSSVRDGLLLAKCKGKPV